MNVNQQKEFEEFLDKIQPRLNQLSKRHKYRICRTCGEVYNLNDFSAENPLECCGECGGLDFIIRSKNPLIGFESIEHYDCFMNILPKHLRDGAQTIRELEEVMNYKDVASYLAKN